jgi:hypothetical protein
MIYLLLRAIKYEPSRLKIDKPYFRPATTFAATLHCKAGLDLCDLIDIELQYVYQQTQQKKKESSTYHEIQYSRSHRIDMRGDILPLAPLPLKIKLRLPELTYEHKWETDLDHPTENYYWLLTIHAKTTGLDYRSKFILPVYSSAGQSS